MCYTDLTSQTEVAPVSSRFESGTCESFPHEQQALHGKLKTCAGEMQYREKIFSRPQRAHSGLPFRSTMEPLFSEAEERLDNGEKALRTLRNLSRTEFESLAEAHGVDPELALAFRSLLSRKSFSPRLGWIESRPTDGGYKWGPPLHLGEVLTTIYPATRKEHYEVSATQTRSTLAHKDPTVQRLDRACICVGCVVQFLAPDCLPSGRELKEEWHGLVVRVVSDPTRPDIVAQVVWLYGKEDLVGIGFLEEANDLKEREVFLSNYKYEVAAETVARVYKALPGVLGEPEAEDILFFNNFVDVQSKTVHALKLVAHSEFSRRDFALALQVLQSWARAWVGPVRSRHVELDPQV